MIICAAIKIRFERNGQTVEAVVPGLRHGDIRDLLADLGVPIRREEEDGFITHNGDFLDRLDAFEHALACGQLSATTREEKAARSERQLFSENLY